MFFVLERVSRVVLQAASFIVLARYLSPELLGHVALVSSLFGFLSVCSVFGLDQIVMRSASVSPQRGQNLANRAVVLSVGIGVLLGAALAASAPFVPTEFERDALLLLSAGLPLASASIAQSYLLAIGRSAGVSKILLAESVLMSILRIGLCVVEAPPFIFVVLILVDAVLVAAIAFTALARARSVTLRLSPRGGIYRKILASGAPLAANAIVAFLYLRIDQFMLRALETAAVVGIYAVALKILDMLMFVLSTLFRYVSPRLFQLYRDDEERFLFTVEKGFALVFLGSVLSALLAALVGREAFGWVFGEAYAEASTVITILLLAMPALLVGQLAGVVSVSRNALMLPLVRTTVGLATNIVGNLILIPALGLAGAAIATLIAVWTSSVLTLPFARSDRRLFLSLLRGMTLVGALRRRPSPARPSQGPVRCPSS